MIDQIVGTEPVECTEVVYRALKKGWEQGEPIPSEAFMRKVRELETEKAVSLSRRKYVTPESVARNSTGCVAPHLFMLDSEGPSVWT